MHAYVYILFNVLKCMISINHSVNHYKPVDPELISTPFGEMKIPDPIMLPTMIATPFANVIFRRFSC